MLELTPKPNVIIEFNGEETESAAAGFRVLSALCAVLACASRVMRLMPGNEQSGGAGGRNERVR